MLRLFVTPSGPVAITPHGIFIYANGTWQGDPVGDTIRKATVDRSGSIWLLTGRNIIEASGSKSILLPEKAVKDNVNCLFWEDQHTLCIGTNSGLFVWRDNWLEQPLLQGITVHDIAADASGTLWVASADGLWKREGERWVNLDETLMAVGNQRTYLALATRNDNQDLIFSSPLSVGVIAADGQHQAWRGTDGLPYGPAHVIRPIGEQLWLGTSRGVIVKADQGWHYFNGRRWLPHEKVNDMIEVSPGVTWVATAGGISEIGTINLSLEEKARHYAEVIEKRHNRRGLVNLSKLAKPGDIGTSYSENEDNDGLWTSCFLAAECFRYAVTQLPEAREKAVRTFEALERLEAITGISGYPARSYALATDSVVQSKSPHPKYWHLSPDGQWRWLDDTSSDEITGHLFTLSLFYELVADEAQKQRVVRLMDRIMTHIIDHDFHLIDPDGKPTRWGVWHPDSLNHAPNWLYEKGLNSLQILSHLKTVAHFTGNPRYEKVYEKLVREHGYAQNALYAKQYGPFETSHSDDILNFFPYYGLFRYAKDAPEHPLFVKSLERSWKAVQNDRMPVWNVMASALLGRDCDLDVALKELREYPLDLVDWTMENSHRWDVTVDPLVDRSGRKQAITPISTPEASVSRWNTNPKRLDSGRGGMTEESGTYFLFAYWMGRYYGLF